MRPCGPHLRVSETSRRCDPADAGAVPFPARGQLPRMCRRAEGARRRAGTPCRAATPTDTARRRPPRPRTCSPNLRRQQALPGSHGNVAAVPLELCPGLGGRTVAFAGVSNVPREGTSSRRPLGGSRRAAHTAPGGPRPPRRPDAPLVPRVRLGAGSRPGRARRPRHQTGGRELGRPPRAAAGEGRAPQRFRRLGPRLPRGQALLPGGLRNLVRLRLCGL